LALGSIPRRSALPLAAELSIGSRTVSRIASAPEDSIGSKTASKNRTLFGGFNPSLNGTFFDPRGMFINPRVGGTFFIPPFVMGF
jgi:hypothetical protein